METLTSILRLIHIVNAMLMIWPFYVALRGRSLGDLFIEPVLAIKFFSLLLIGGLLTFVHLSLQPRIDALFAQTGGAPATPELAKQIGPLRIQRKRLATVCLFVVLLSTMFGIQVGSPFPFWLTLVLTAVIGLFTWRSYSSVTPYGWA